MTRFRPLTLVEQAEAAARREALKQDVIDAELALILLPEKES